MRPIRFLGVFAFQAKSQKLIAKSASATSKFYGQVTKGAWWMPWQKMAMKDVASCDKPLGSRKQALIRGCPNGETHAGKTGVRPDEYIVGYERTQGSEPSQYLKEKKETSIA